MTTNRYVPRGLGLACFLFSALFAAVFAIVAVSKFTVISPVVLLSLALFGGGAAMLFFLGRALFRRP